jgi:hypothetical protein
MNNASSYHGVKNADLLALIQSHVLGTFNILSIFLKHILKSPISPFGKLADYWYRVEFQHRGSPHVHMLLWIENAPQYNKDTTEQVVKYVDSIICCQRNWDDQEMEIWSVYKYTGTHGVAKKYKKICSL